MKTPFDFEKGDPIVQAIGPDPFIPTGFRIFTFDAIPGAFPAPILDIANLSPTSRYAAMWVRGGSSKAEALTNSITQRAPWQNAIVLDAVADVGINWKADFTDAAILFQQPNHEQPIKWYYGKREPQKPPAEATLTVAQATGDFTFKGGDARFSGSVDTTGLSADATPARNLRGKNVAVKAGVESADVDLRPMKPTVRTRCLSNRAGSATVRLTRKPNTWFYGHIRKTRSGGCDD